MVTAYDHPNWLCDSDTEARFITFTASSVVQGAGQGVVQQAAQVAKGAEPAVSSDLASSAASTEDSLTATKDSAEVPSADGVATAAKQAGDAVYVPGGTLSSSLGQRAGPQIDGMDIVSLGGKQPDAKDVAPAVAGVAKTAAGVVLGPYIGTVRTGVSTAGAVVQGVDGAFGAAKQAVQQAQQQGQQQQAAAAAKKQQKRVYTPAIALFPGAGPEANELADQIKNTLGLPTPDSAPSKSQGAGQKRFNHSKAGRRHQ